MAVSTTGEPTAKADAGDVTGDGQSGSARIARKAGLLGPMALFFLGVVTLVAGLLRERLGTDTVAE